MYIDVYTLFTWRALTNTVFLLSGSEFQSPEVCSSRQIRCV